MKKYIMERCNKKILKNGVFILECSVYYKGYKGYVDDESKRMDQFVAEAISITKLGRKGLKSKTSWCREGGINIIRTLDKDPNLIRDSLISLLKKYKIAKY